MVSCRILSLNLFAAGISMFGMSSVAHAVLPSEADKANVTARFADYEYQGPNGDGLGYEFQVLSNRWLYLQFGLRENDESFVSESYIDCGTGQYHWLESQNGGGVRTSSWSVNDKVFTISVDGVVEQTVNLPDEMVLEIAQSHSEICQHANLADGFSSAIASSSTPNSQSPSTPQTTPSTTLQIANKIVASTAAHSLGNIGQLLVEEDQPELAAAYLKGSLEAYEQARLSPNAQQPTKEAVERTYRLLISTLLDQDRTLEAQETLDAFTVWELADYLEISAPRAEMRVSQQPEAQQYAQAKALSKATLAAKPSPIARASGSSAPVTILTAERDILVAHNAEQAGAMASGIELAKLLEIEPAQRTAAQKERIAQLRALENEINRDFNAFIASPKIKGKVDELSDKAQRQTVNPTYFNPLRNKLKQLNAAVVYPLILEDRIELVVTTSQTAPLRRTVFVEQDEVVSNISAFRRGLLRQGRTKQLRSRAEQLHQWLIEPIEADLKKAGVTSILYAPYGQLRYIPLTALHDGDQWLVEKYGVSTITALSLQELTAQRKPNPRLLAAAFADTTVSYKFPLGDRFGTMSGLPFAGLEVELLTEKRKNYTALIDQDFSLEKVLPIMDQFDVIHFATHAAFIPGKPEDSFIMFGNGDRATLADVADWVLPNVQMAVLSACQTGYGRVLDSGIEVLGLGYQFHKVGAQSVMASLWSVDDGGTQVLMNQFYDNLDQGMTKNEALQAAQIAMLKGEEGFAHPYFWSSFITIGNGL